jgi:hypothetical protein
VAFRPQLSPRQCPYGSSRLISPCRLVGTGAPFLCCDGLNFDFGGVVGPAAIAPLQAALSLARSCLQSSVCARTAPSLANWRLPEPSGRSSFGKLAVATTILPFAGQSSPRSRADNLGQIRRQHGVGDHRTSQSRERLELWNVRMVTAVAIDVALVAPSVPLWVGALIRKADINRSRRRR